MTERGIDRKRIVLRGGSWYNNDPDNLRAAYRNNDHPDNRNDNIGFRLVAALQHSLWSQGLQTRVPDFTESGSVFEGVQIDLPGLAVSIGNGEPKSVLPHSSLVILLR